MSDETKTGSVKITPGSSEQAPFIYFDGVTTYGLSNGVVQIELASHTLVPDGANIRADILITAHLRCSQAAAAALREAISKALEAPNAQHMMQPMPAGKPN